MRSPTLVLFLIACLVGVLTSRLFAAKQDWTPAAVAAISAEARPGATLPVEHPLLTTRFAGMEDELLASPMLRHPGFQAEVRRWVRFWKTRAAERFPTFLVRMTGFVEMVDETLELYDLPPSLRYLPVIESGYSPSAVSSAKAVGLWQFMEPTARDFGIEVTRYVDDRRDPFASTVAAAEFLSDLRRDFGSWFLALAAYNAGPDRIRRILRKHARGASPSDSVYWSVRHALPRETREYMPNLIAAIIVASDPEAHGYELPELRRFEFDEVPVRGTFTFERVARATGVSRAEIARLNPEYVRGQTPARRQVDLRIPTGTSQSFREYFAAATQRGTDAPPP